MKKLCKNCEWSGDESLLADGVCPDCGSYNLKDDSIKMLFANNSRLGKIIDSNLKGINKLTDTIDKGLIKSQENEN